MRPSAGAVAAPGPPTAKEKAPKPPRRAWAVLVVAASLASGCGSTASRAAPPAPALVVATTAYPLAQVAALIGGAKTRVIGLVPPGSDPFTFQPGPAQVAAVKEAGLFLYPGASAQPGFSSTDVPPARKLDLSTSAAEPYFWLDPAAMRAEVPVVETAMESADPANSADFRSGARDLEVELDSTAIDFQSTLSTCPRRTVFAADNAFAGLAKRYNLDYVSLGASSGAAPTAAGDLSASVKSSGATAVFAETWIPDSTVAAVAAAARVRVLSLDTLLGPPPSGWPKQATYLNLLEANLGRLSSGLGCASSTGP